MELDLRRLVGLKNSKLYQYYSQRRNKLPRNTSRKDHDFTSKSISKTKAWKHTNLTQ